MKHFMLCLLLASASFHAYAQQPGTHPVTMPAASAQTQALRFGFFSYKAAFEAMPDYAIVRRNLDDLRIKYDAEMKRVEDEFNSKYEAFLEGQRDFAPSILQKRQAELQELMEKNMAFKQEAKRLLTQAEAEAYKPLREKLAAAVLKVGAERGLAFILNTDDNTVPYVNVNMGEDVSGAIALAL